MRHFLLLILLTTCTMTLFAQDDNLSEYTRVIGGFGGPVVKYTRVYGQGAIMFGARGGWVINHSLIIGGAIYGIVSEVNAPTVVPPADTITPAGPMSLQLSCFGLESEYVFHPDTWIHYGVYGFIGGGSIRYVRRLNPSGNRDTRVDDSDLALVFEPGANIEVNLNPWVRLMTGVSYRIVSGVSQIGLTNSDLRGFAVSLTLKLGNF